MIGLIRYGFATMLHSQRYLAPVLLFTGVLGVFSSGDSGPLAPVYALGAALLFVCSTWFTIVLLGVEDPAHRAITIVAAGRSRRLLLASIAVAMLSSLVLAGFALVFPLLVARHPVAGLDLVVGLEAQLTCASVGIAIGLLCSRLVIRRQGFALVTALALVIVALLAPGMVPVNVLIHRMSEGSTSAALVAPVSGLLAIAVVILAACATATQFVATRRD